MADPSPTRWHRLLGALLDAVLSPVGVSVETDIAVTAEPPRANLLLLRREQPHWNKAQRVIVQTPPPQPSLPLT